MREDMEDVLLNTGRVGSRRNRMLQKHHRDYWDAESEKMHQTWDRETRDRITPLLRYLRKNCGKPWNKVWADVCKVADNRSLRGNHLRDHVLQYVYWTGTTKEAWHDWLLSFTRRSGDLFLVDDHGILRNVKGKKEQKKQVERFFHQDNKTKLFYLYTANGWYEARTVKECWYGFYKPGTFIGTTANECVVPAEPIYLTRQRANSIWKLSNDPYRKGNSYARWVGYDIRKLSRSEVNSVLRIGQIPNPTKKK